jgi:hypothetical protein
MPPGRTRTSDLRLRKPFLLSPRNRAKRGCLERIGPLDETQRRRIYARVERLPRPILTPSQITAKKHMPDPVDAEIPSTSVHQCPPEPRTSGPQMARGRFV